MKNQNKWEALFESWLSLTEFSLIKHRNPELVLHYQDYDDNPVEEVHEGVWSIYDEQGANLGGINQDRFDNAGQILDRMEVYIIDYILDDLEEELDVYVVDMGNREVPWSADQWLALRDDVEFYNKNKEYFEEHSYEFDLLDMIANHFEEIDLENVYYEEKE